MITIERLRDWLYKQILKAERKAERDVHNLVWEGQKEAYEKTLEQTFKR